MPLPKPRRPAVFALLWAIGEWSYPTSTAFSRIQLLGEPGRDEVQELMR